MRKLGLSVLVLLAGAGIAWGQGGMKKKKPLPYEFGAVVMGNYSQQAGMPPVLFDHWVHRQHYSCRLCHVDIGFGMTAGSTKVKAADNMKGFYCGTCHNGRMSIGKQKIFESCAKEYTREQYPRCARCHALQQGGERQEAFFRFSERMPAEPFGNGINWEKAEQEGAIKLIDYLPGVSVAKAKFKSQQDFSLSSKIEGMPDIIFSHQKHTTWSGCELCHPEIFTGIRKGSTKYSMIEVFDGKYCGVCHGKVAFPSTDCQRCHSKPV
jgi:c(7)-type cytochrome triheme protein